jgi:hypothetical protein
MHIARVYRQCEEIARENGVRKRFVAFTQSLLICIPIISSLYFHFLRQFAHIGGTAHVKGLRDPFLRHAGLFRDDVREQGFGWGVLREISQCAAFKPKIFQTRTHDGFCHLLVIGLVLEINKKSLHRVQAF